MSCSVTANSNLKRLLSRRLFPLAAPKGRTAGTECNSGLLKQSHLSTQASHIQALFLKCKRHWIESQASDLFYSHSNWTVVWVEGRYALFQKSFRLWFSKRLVIFLLTKLTSHFLLIHCVFISFGASSRKLVTPPSAIFFMIVTSVLNDMIKELVFSIVSNST